MDNQQAKAVDLAWLAGIIDGEGTIMFNNNGHKGSYRGINIVPVIYLTNTCGNIIDEAVRIIGEIGFNPRIYTKQYKAKDEWRPSFRIDVNKYSHMMALLEAVMPYLRSKHGEASLVMRFLKSRDGKNRRPFTNDEIQIIDEYMAEFGYKRAKCPIGMEGIAVNRYMPPKPQRLDVGKA